MSRTAGAAIAAGVLLSVAGAAAQGSIFRSRTELTVMNVSVRDGDGHAVRNLTADRFALREDDQPRAVAALAHGDEPLSLVIALDVSASMEGRRYQAARKAVTTFFAARRPDDDYYVLGFNDRVIPIAPGSQSIDTIQAALEGVKPVGTTFLYGAVSTAIDTLRMSANRRRAVVVISDGRDSTPPPPDERDAERAAFVLKSRTMERVERSEALIYAIGIDGPILGARGALDKEFDAKALRDLTEPTGGTAIVVRTNEAVPDAAMAIVDDLRQQYVLGFEPAHPDDGRFHRVTVRVNGCECRVRTRRGFIAANAAKK